MQISFGFAHISLTFFFFSPTFEGETAYLSVQNGWVSNARCKLLVFNRVETENCSRECRDTRLVRPPQQSCIYAFNFTWTDARPVRPYMQSHPYHNAISAISSYDITHFARWNGPFLSLNRVISDGQTMYFVSRNGPFVIVTLSFLPRIHSKNDRHFMLVAQLFGCQCVVKTAQNARISVMVCFRFEYASYARLLVKEFHVMFRAILKGS